MKAIEQYSPGVLFIMLHNVVLTFESVNETLKCEPWCFFFYNLVSDLRVIRGIKNCSVVGATTLRVRFQEVPPQRKVSKGLNYNEKILHLSFRAVCTGSCPAFD